LKFAFLTLGCRLNQFESDSLITSFIENGYTKTSFKEKADIYIINTCTVTGKSDSKSRNAINRAVKTNPDALVIVTGCYSETDRGDIERIEGVDFIVPNKQKHGIFKLVEEKLKSKNLTGISDDPFDFYPPLKGEHTRSYLKIQDGCDNFCAYCKIPFARGNPVSRDFNDTLNAFNLLIGSGIKEVVLTGINIGKVNYSLEGLISSLLDTEGIFRLHLSSIEMPDVTQGIINFLSNKKFIKHFHIPLQSGSDKILKLMNRKYTSSDYIDLIKRIKEQCADVNLTTDVLTGFPGESDADHKMTLDVIKECEFSHVHTFPYSKRVGTKASAMNNQITSDIKSQRSLEIRELSDDLSISYKKKFAGKNIRLLVEKNNICIDGKTYSTGKSDNYVDAFIPSKLEKSCFYEVKALRVENSILYAGI
jgi:threonylcarbamoyladenosine tRNA methylthiotransferase MtaB